MVFLNFLTKGVKIELEVSYIKRLYYGYINVKDVKEIVDFKSKKKKFVIISL